MTSLAYVTRGGRRQFVSRGLRKRCVEESAWVSVWGLALERPCLAVRLFYQVAGRTYTPVIRLTYTPTFVRRTPQPWLVCPACHKKAGKLYIPRGETQLRCRLCWDLRYRSQQTRKRWRELESQMGRPLRRIAPPPITAVHYEWAPRPGWPRW